MNNWMKVVCVAAALGVSGAGVHLATAQDEAAPAAEAKADGKGKKGKRGEGREGREGRGGMRGGLARVALELQGVTPEQKTKLEAIQTEAEEHMKAARAAAAETTGTTTDRSAGREKRQEMMKAQREKVEAVLTDTQKTELAGKIEAMRGDRQGKPPKE